MCVSAGYLRIRRCEVVRYDGLTTVPYPSYCLAVTRRRRIVVLAEREFIVSGGLGRCSTMTKLTVESLSRIHSALPIPSLSFSETQIQGFFTTTVPSYHDGSSSPTFCGYPTPSQLLTRVTLLLQFPFLMLYFPPSPDGSQECIMRAIESLLSFAGCLPPLLWISGRPLPAVDKSNAHVTVSSSHALLPPSLMDIRNVS